MKTHNHGAQIDTEQDAWDWITDMFIAARDFVLWSAALGLVAGVAWRLLS